MSGRGVGYVGAEIEGGAVHRLRQLLLLAAQNRFVVVLSHAFDKTSDAFVVVLGDIGFAHGLHGRGRSPGRTTEGGVRAAECALTGQDCAVLGHARPEGQAGQRVRPGSPSLSVAGADLPASAVHIRSGLLFN
jgi:hypothetical protein